MTAVIAAPQPLPERRLGRSGTRGLGAFRRSRYLAVGSVILAVFALAAIFGPLFVHDANSFSGDKLAHPSLSHWLGTTQTGQDVFAQLVQSTRGTLLVGLGAGLIATIVSVAVGVGGALTGGFTDDALNLLSNVALVIPQLPLVIIVAAFARGSGTFSEILVIALTSWAASARILRGQTLSLRERDYVLAARAGGEPGWKVALFDVIPNELPIIGSQFIYATIAAVLTVSTLAFLGLADPSQLSWGNMLYFAQNDEALDSGAWWWFAPPGLCIALLGVGLAMVNFGLDEIFNPRLRVYREPRGRRKGRGSAGSPDSTEDSDGTESVDSTDSAGGSDSIDSAEREGVQP
ncbi:MAG TPA: ABC transporter permease [Actinospica sp.]|nr:ABC transporter permease [Actinospica sp.]